MKNHASVGEVLDPARDLTASRMSIFRTYPDLLQTRSLCLILRTYTISRVCMKSKIPFPLRKIFFGEELDRGGARKCRQKSSFWVEWPTRGLVLPMFSICRMGSPRFILSAQNNIFRNKNRIFSFIQTRDMVYVRSIKRKERVYNKFGWVLKIDIEKSWDF